MYEQHFGLHDKPFRVVPSPRFLFVSDTHDECRARILYGIRESRGFVVVTGAVGLGKTTMILSVLDGLDSDCRTALVFNPVDSFEGLLRLVCLEFGVESEAKDEVGLLWDLNLYLVDRLAQGETCVLLIDEAQNLSLDLLEKVRTLSNLQTENASLLQVVLVGQPELREKLDDPRIVQLRQRVGVWYEILPLTASETEEYIWHRLHLAGHPAPSRLFTPAICRRIHEIGQGVPRLTNQLCDTALVIAFGAGQSEVSRATVEDAARELRLLPASARSPASVAPEDHEEESSSGGVTHDPGSLDGTKDAHDRSRLGLALRLAAVLVLVVLAVAWISGGLGGILRDLTGTTSASESAQLPSDATAQGDPIEGVDVSSSPADEQDGPRSVVGLDGESSVETRPSPSRVDPQHLSALRRWRDEGVPVYTAHLASFRDTDQVDEFVTDLLVSNREWEQPIFVERTNSGWLRVMGGGFDDRSLARQWVTDLKGKRGFDYAQLERLDHRAEALVPAPHGR